MKPIIGIVGRTNILKNNKYNIFVNDNHRRAVIKSGGIPISILPTQNIKYEQKDNKKGNVPLTEEEKEDIVRVIEKCEGIILQGGNYSYYYDEFIARYCIENDIPILGTCMGMQVLAAVDCNTSRMKNVTFIKSQINHKQLKNKYAHSVIINKNSLLHSIIGKNNIEVNSRHMYRIIQLNNAINVAESNDGIIEAIEFPNKKFAIGVQWHPEDLFDTDENMLNLFKAFINAALNIENI